MFARLQITNGTLWVMAAEQRSARRYKEIVKGQNMQRTKCTLVGNMLHKDAIYEWKKRPLHCIP